MLPVSLWRIMSVKVKADEEVFSLEGHVEHYLMQYHHDSQATPQSHHLVNTTRQDSHTGHRNSWSFIDIIFARADYILQSPLECSPFSIMMPYSQMSNRRGKLGGLAWKQSGMWENVSKFPKTKRRKYPQYTSEWWCVIMCKSNRCTRLICPRPDCPPAC